MTDVVVVGAGIGGLAVAARLATQGHAVTVVEQAGTYGGKLARLERSGFVFDTGPSLLTLPAVYRDLFLKTARRRADAALEDNVELVPVDPSFAYRFADGSSVEIPDASRAGAAAALDAALGAGTGRQWTALLDHAATVWAVTRGPFLTQPLEGPAALLRRSLRLGDLRTVAPFTTLRELGRRRLADPRLRQVLDRYATYQGSDPRRAPSALVVIPYVEQTFGAWHVAGGVARLADAVHARCEQRGVQFRFDSPVDRLVVTGGRVAGVELAGGERLPADVVVSDVDAATLYGRLLAGEPTAARPRHRVARSTPSLSGFRVLLGLRGRTPGLRHHTVSFPADYDAEFDAVFGPRPRPVDDPAIAVCCPDDPAMRPDDDHEAWSVLVNAPRHDPENPARGIDWDQPGRADAYADHVLDVLAGRGLDVRDRVVVREVLTPADLERAAAAPGGSIYGQSSNGPRAAFRRPANRSPVPGLFLVGGSAHPGGGLPLVGLSAEIVADLVGPA
jgi:phytoene desaturase